jgi:drug/metabolite transporter (DMT)-like permease
MFKGVLLVFLGACSFGILSTFMKLSIQRHHYSVENIASAQAFFGMIVLWAIYYVSGDSNHSAQLKKNSSVEKPLKGTSAWTMILAGSSVGMSTYVYYLGVNLLPASIAIVLLMNYTWMCLLIELIFFGKRPTGLQFLSVIMVLAGTMLAGGLFNGSAGQLNNKGVLLVLVAAFIYAIAIVSSGRLGNNLRPIQKSALFITGSALSLFLITWPTFLFDGLLLSEFALWALFFALFGTIIPPVLFAIGMPKTGVGLGAIMTSAELPVAVITASIVLNEKVSLPQWWGIVIILLALIIPNLYRKRVLV